MPTLDEQIQQSISDWNKQQKDEERASRSGLYKFLSYAPLIGTSFDLADTFRDPTWENASQFGISLASDLIGMKAIKSLWKEALNSAPLPIRPRRRFGFLNSWNIRHNLPTLTNTVKATLATTPKVVDPILNSQQNPLFEKRQTDSTFDATKRYNM